MDNRFGSLFMSCYDAAEQWAFYLLLLTFALINLTDMKTFTAYTIALNLLQAVSSAIAVYLLGYMYVKIISYAHIHKRSYIQKTLRQKIEPFAIIAAIAAAAWMSLFLRCSGGR